VPENAFFRIENLRAFDLQAVSEEKTNRLTLEPACRFAFRPSVPRVRRCYGLLSG